MASQTRRHDVALSTIGEQQKTDLSGESNEVWTPDRNVKMALAVQTFCVVRQNQISRL
jgi:hypothetical protein